MPISYVGKDIINWTELIVMIVMADPRWNFTRGIFFEQSKVLAPVNMLTKYSPKPTMSGLLMVRVLMQGCRYGQWPAKQKVFGDGRFPHHALVPELRVN